MDLIIKKKNELELKGIVAKKQSDNGNILLSIKDDTWETPHLCKGKENLENEIKEGDYIVFRGSFKKIAGLSSQFLDYFEFHYYKIIPDPQMPHNETIPTPEQTSQTSKSYQISPISKGHYNVSIDLSKWFSKNELSAFAKKLQSIESTDNSFKKLCSLNGHILQYTSESLFPEKISQEKKNILIVLGNPATHSVANGMFFYSKKNGTSHQFWGKLQKADLMPRIRLQNLEQEAEWRKKIILEGETSNSYLLGLTTFYSFPTPVEGEYKDVKGVEELFRPSLRRVRDMELNRLLQYPFSQNAISIFTQKSSYDYAKRQPFWRKIIYWPLRGQYSGGDDLSAKLNDVSF